MTATIDYKAQRAILEEEAQKAEDELQAMISLHEAVSLGVSLGEQPTGKLEALEKRRIERTNDLARARSSLQELARREAASITAAEAAHRRKLEGDLQKAIAATEGSGTKVVAAIDALVDAVQEAEADDQAAGGLAHELGMESYGPRRQGSRRLAEIILIAKLGRAGHLEAQQLMPKEVPAVVQALGTAATYRPKRAKAA